MKYLSVLMLFLLIHILIGCKEKVGTMTRVDSEISADLLSNSKIISNKLFLNIKEGKYSEVEQIASSQLMTTTNNQLSGVLSQLKPLFESNNFEHFHTYYTNNFSAESDTSTNQIGPIIPSLSSNLLIINNFNFIGKECLNTFYKSTNAGMQYLIWFSFSRYNDKWKLNYLSVGDYGVAGDNANGITKKALNNSESNEILTAVVLSMVASKILRPAQTLQYPNEKQLLTDIQKIQRKAKDEIKFPLIMDNGKPIIAINHSITKQGISPVIVYLTKTKLDKSLIEKEAEKLFSSTIKTYPELEKNFDFTIIKAFNEMPNNPKKQYSNHTVIINNKTKKVFK